MCPPPNRLVSDNRLAFACTLFEGMCEFYSIKHSLGCSCPQQTQGQTEQAHKSIVTLLRAFVNDKQRHWVQYLPISSLGNKHHNVTGNRHESLFCWCLGERPCILLI